MHPFQTQLDLWRRETGAAAVAASIRVNGSLVWHGASQTADSEQNDRVAPQSRFSIYSITKTFTAVCVLCLHAAGHLRLDDPVAAWFSDERLPENATLRHLLRHTSGLPDYGPLRAYHDAVRSRPSEPWTDSEFLEAALAGGLRFEPGEGWSYSNIGYLLLRRIIERAGGATFRRCVDEHVVAPLSLTDTFVAETTADWASCMPGYGREVSIDGNVVDIRSSYHPDWCAPGVAVSTVDEVTMFYDGLFNGRVLDQEHLKQMLHVVRVPGNHPPSVSPSYGMGVMADPDGSFGASYGHGGGGPGYSVFASIVPRSRVGRLSVAVFCNNSLGVDIEPIVYALCEAATATSG